MPICEIHEEARKGLEMRMENIEKGHEALRADVKEIGRLTVSVEKMAVNIQSMVEELKDQGERLKTLENEDGEKWRKVTSQVILCVVTAVVGFALAKLGF